MNTSSTSKDGYRLAWTADGENYRYYIEGVGTGHIYTTGSGTGHESAVQPTRENMSQALGRFIRVSDHATRTE